MALGCSGLVEVISRDDFFVFISKKSYNIDIIIQKKARIFSKSKKYRFPANYFKNRNKYSASFGMTEKKYL